MPTINNILSRQCVLCISVPRGRNQDMDSGIMYSIITDNVRCIIIHDKSNTFYRNFEKKRYTTPVQVGTSIYSRCPLY